MELLVHVTTTCSASPSETAVFLTRLPRGPLCSVSKTWADLASQRVRRTTTVLPQETVVHKHSHTDRHWIPIELGQYGPLFPPPPSSKSQVALKGSLCICCSCRGKKKKKKALSLCLFALFCIEWSLWNVRNVFKQRETKETVNRCIVRRHQRATPFSFYSSTTLITSERCFFFLPKRTCTSNVFPENKKTTKSTFHLKLMTLRRYASISYAIFAQIVSETILVNHKSGM